MTYGKLTAKGDMSLLFTAGALAPVPIYRTPIGMDRVNSLQVGLSLSTFVLTWHPNCPGLYWSHQHLCPQSESDFNSGLSSPAFYALAELLQNCALNWNCH